MLLLTATSAAEQPLNPLRTGLQHQGGHSLESCIHLRKSFIPQRQLRQRTLTPQPPYLVAGLAADLSGSRCFIYPYGPEEPNMGVLATDFEY
jgi:hypothetical protein